MSVWTNERVKTLKELWPTSLSAAQIAKRFNHPNITRNSVISKAHRLGLSGRKSPTRHTTFKRQAAKPKPPRPFSQQVLIGPSTGVRKEAQLEKLDFVAEDDPPPAERISFADLQDCHCRWPIGEVGAPDFGFCGRQKIPISKYCATHAARSVQSQQPRAPRASRRPRELSKRAPINSEFQ